MNLKVLIGREEIRKRVKELAEEISRDYRDKEPILVGILNGAIIFLSDLVRELKIPVEIDFIKIKSYAGMESQEPEIKLDIEREIEGEHLLLIEDIIDTGVTIHYLKQTLLPRKPASLKICALLDKPERRKVDIKADYIGFSVPDKFVVGYGLDINGKFRELPDVYYVEA